LSSDASDLEAATTHAAFSSSVKSYSSVSFARNSASKKQTFMLMEQEQVAGRRKISENLRRRLRKTLTTQSFSSDDHFL
jgi:hypothetical protein